MSHLIRQISSKRIIPITRYPVSIKNIGPWQDVPSEWTKFDYYRNMRYVSGKLEIECLSFGAIKVYAYPGFSQYCDDMDNENIRYHRNEHGRIILATRDHDHILIHTAIPDQIYMYKLYASVSGLRLEHLDEYIHIDYYNNTINKFRFPCDGALYISDIWNLVIRSQHAETEITMVSVQEYLNPANCKHFFIKDGCLSECMPGTRLNVLRARRIKVAGLC